MKKGLIFIVALVLFVSILGGAAFAQSERLWGLTAEGTAVDISQEGWDTSTYVLVARSDFFTDALAGASLSYAIWDLPTQAEDTPAPILLTNPRTLSPETRSEIQRLNASIVIILGGPGAVLPEVETQLRQVPGVTEVQRIWGQTAAGTAKDIFERMRVYNNQSGTSQPDTAIIATQVNFQDALAVSSPAAGNSLPILLTNLSSLPAETLEALSQGGIRNIIIVGGGAVVSGEVETDLNNRGYPVLARLWGTTEYDTASAIANAVDLFNLDYLTVYVARGDWFTDALAGGAAASWGGTYEDEEGNFLAAPVPVVLVRPTSIPEVTRNWLVTNRDFIGLIYILGGPGAITDSVKNEVDAIVY